MAEYKPYKSGKVREVYDLGDHLIMVATDRISAFDHILKNKVTGKGVILTKMSEFWFNLTADILPNHLLTTDNDAMPEFFRQEEFLGRSTKCRKLRMLPLECIVRGYITGSGWESYRQDGTICGIKLPPGLKEAEKLTNPIFTPSTKAELGDHDENVSLTEAARAIEKSFPGKGEEYAAKACDYSLRVYEKCAAYAKERGIIIADTKFEFGVDDEGQIRLADEVLTPDSSRFWPLAGYTPGQSQPSYDKQFVRDWLKANPTSDYALPQDIIDKTIAKYQEAYDLLTR
ncbi:MAG: phosphoribosylaminoimidazolesuccinocarboxamide synthase [Selenomonadaceae bacterium]|nr:phosphoribosylaminoimidazolesuccinocarboxamide synthase [Selenomonadaceae bacterium]